MWWFTPITQHVGGRGKKNLRSLLNYTGVEGQPGLCDSPPSTDRHQNMVKNDHFE